MSRFTDKYGVTVECDDGIWLGDRIFYPVAGGRWKWYDNAGTVSEVQEYYLTLALNRIATTRPFAYKFGGY